jgi:hypothetical protein
MSLRCQYSPNSNKFESAMEHKIFFHLLTCQFAILSSKCRSETHLGR